MAAIAPSDETNDGVAAQKAIDIPELREMIMLNLDYYALKAARCVSRDFEATYQASEKLKTILFRSHKPVLSMLDPTNVAGTSIIEKKFDIKGGVNPRFCEIRMTPGKILPYSGTIYEASIEIPGVPASGYVAGLPAKAVRFEPSEQTSGLFIQSCVYQSNELCFDESEAWREKVCFDINLGWRDEYLLYPFTAETELRIYLRIRQPSINVFECKQMRRDERRLGCVMCVLRVKTCSMGELLDIANVLYRFADETWLGGHELRIVTTMEDTRDLMMERGLSPQKAALISSTMLHTVNIYSDS